MTSSSRLRRGESGYEDDMTTPDEDATSESAKDEEVLTPATPGAEALPLPDGEVEKPSEE